MLISFEGIDGCGKTTHIKLLETWLKDKGYKVFTIREPGGTEISEEIRNIILHTKKDMGLITELLLFEASRAQLIQDVIIPKLNADFIVLTDRFVDSTLAYQGYGRGISHGTIEELNKFVTDGLVPDITFYLRINIGRSSQRTDERTMKDRIESSNDEFFHRIYKGFEEIADKNAHRIHKIDAMGSMNETFKQITTILETKAIFD